MILFHNKSVRAGEEERKGMKKQKGEGGIKPVNSHIFIPIYILKEYF